MITKFQNIEKSWKKINFKNVLGSIGFAIILWLFVSLNDSYITWVQVPLFVELPDNRALEKAPESTLLFEVKGTGWQLFNLLFFNTSAQCYVNLNKAKIDSDTYIVAKDELIKSADLLKNIEIKNVRPESIQLSTGQISIKKVPIIPDVKIIPSEGFTVVGNLKLQPDSVTIKGNTKIIQDIKFWLTENATMTEKIRSFNFTIHLKDSLRNIIDISPDYVDVSVNIQQSAQKIISDVEVKINGKQLPPNYIIQPQKVSVIITGGINEVTKVSPNEVSAFINYSEIISDSVGVFKPEIRIPNNVSLLYTNPSVIRIIRMSQ